MDVPHLFTHSSIGGQLGCFCASAVVNNAVMNVLIHVFEHLSPIFLDRYFHPMKILFNFLKKTKLFTTEAEPSYPLF